MTRTSLLYLVVAGLFVISGCGDDTHQAAPMVSPDLDCDGAAMGAFEPDLDYDIPGVATADEALDDVLVGWAAKFDADVVTLRPGVKAMVVDGRNVAVVFAREAPAGGYWADSTHYCQPFMIESTNGYVPDTAAPEAAATETIVACEPVPRFRLGDIEYQNRQFDEQVLPADLGPVVGEIQVYPAGFDRCEPVVLNDGEGSFSVGTEIYQIVGVVPADKLTASLGNDVYLVFHGHPVAP